jgi:hypothetical protein
MDGHHTAYHYHPEWLRVAPSVPGKVVCLGKCGKPFKSPDRVRIRICNACKRDQERVGRIGEQFSGISGVAIPDADGGED